MVYQAYHHNLAILPVVNGRVEIPSHLRRVMAVFLFADTLDRKDACKQACEVANEIEKTIVDGPEQVCDDECNGPVLVVYNINTANPEPIKERAKRGWLIPVMLGDKHLYGNLVEHNPYADKLTLVPYEYSLRDGEMVFSFDSGVVALYYLSEPVNSSGELLVPDDPVVINALAYFCKWKEAELKMSTGTRTAYSFAAYMKQQWTEYKRKAKARLRAETPQDTQKILSNLNTLIPIKSLL